LRSFLNFCFAQFEVVFWSACGKKKLARYKNGLQDITRVIMRSDRIFGQEMCVVSKYRDPSNPDKPIFLKPLAMLFKNCPEANESNTLLIDDSPDKSCMNDPRNSIHPFTYRSGEPESSPPGLVALRDWLLKLREWSQDIREFVEMNRPPWSTPPVATNPERLTLLLEGLPAIAT
jgi:hypothetical protein